MSGAQTTIPHSTSDPVCTPQFISQWAHLSDIQSRALLPSPSPIARPQLTNNAAPALSYQITPAPSVLVGNSFPSERLARPASGNSASIRPGDTYSRLSSMFLFIQDDSLPPGQDPFVQPPAVNMDPGIGELFRASCWCSSIGFPQQ